MPPKKPLPDYSDLARELEERFNLKLTPEYAFFEGSGRKWRFDYAVECCRVALEIEGHGHHRWHNHQKDMEKYNQAAALGWAVLRVPAANRRPKAFMAFTLYFTGRPCIHRK